MNRSSKFSSYFNMILFAQFPGAIFIAYLGVEKANSLLDYFLLFSLVVAGLFSFIVPFKFYNHEYREFISVGSFIGFVLLSSIIFSQVLKRAL